MISPLDTLEEQAKQELRGSIAAAHSALESKVEFLSNMLFEAVSADSYLERLRGIEQARILAREEYEDSAIRECYPEQALLAHLEYEMLTAISDEAVEVIEEMGVDRVKVRRMRVKVADFEARRKEVASG